MKVKLTKFIWLMLIFSINGALIPVGAKEISDDAVLPELALPLFLKIMTYDQAFNADSISSVAVCLVYDEDITSSYEQMVSSRRYFKAKGTLEVRGVPVELATLSVSEFQNYLSDSDENCYCIVIFTNIKKNALQDGLKISRSESIPSFAYDPKLLNNGVSVSVIIYNNKARIIIDIESTQLEGIQYSAHLLKVSELRSKDEAENE